MVDVAGRRARPASSVVAALTAVGLGLAAALAVVAGKTRFEGPVILVVSETHGVHRGDLVGLVPVVAGVLLARWCLRR